MAGTALIQVIDRRPMRSQKPLRWNRSSRTRLEPATSVDSRPTTSALMWNSGSGLKPRSSGPSSRCDATPRAVCSSLSWPNRTTLGVPVVPDEDSTTPPRRRAVAPSPRAGSRARPPGARGGPARSTPRRRRPGRVGRPARRPHRCAPVPPPARRSPVTGMAGSSGATQNPALTAPRKASAKASGSRRRGRRW